MEATKYIKGLIATVEIPLKLSDPKNYYEKGEVDAMNAFLTLLRADLRDLENNDGGNV